MSRRGGRGSARRRRRDEAEDFYKNRDKYKDSEHDKRIDEMFGYGNDGETDRWQESLSDDEYYLIRSYTGDDYEDINKALRDELFDTDDYSTAMKIQGALENFNLTNNIVVHRGDSGGIIPDTWGKTFAQIQDMVHVGDEFVAPSFISTSPNKPFENRLYAYNIKIPKGKGRGAYVRGISVYKSAENEFLIKAGSKFRVTKIKQKDGRIFVDLLMLS